MTGVSSSLEQCSNFTVRLSLLGVCRNAGYGFGPGGWSVTAFLASFRVSQALLVQALGEQALENGWFVGCV